MLSAPAIAAVEADARCIAKGPHAALHDAETRHSVRAEPHPVRSRMLSGGGAGTAGRQPRRGSAATQGGVQAVHLSCGASTQAEPFHTFHVIVLTSGEAAARSNSSRKPLF